MRFWKRLWQRRDGSGPSPTEEDPEVRRQLELACAQLQREVESTAFYVRRLEQCLRVIEARAQHRNDELGPLMPGEGAPEQRIEVTRTVGGPRAQVQELDLLLRHISDTTRAGRRQIYELDVDCGGAAAIYVCRGGDELERSDAEEQWAHDESEANTRGRRIAFDGETLVVFID
jgi:hypothetical protein